MRLNFLTSSDPGYKWPMIALSLAVCLTVIACTWYTGAVPQMVFGHDLFALLEGGWKWNWGILPHHDYYSYIGVLTSFLVFLGMKLGGSAVMAMPAAICLFAICILPVSMYEAFTRMPPFLAFLSSVILTAAAVAPHPLTQGSADFGYAGIYNRWGYCLFLVSLLAITVPPRNPARWKDILDGLIAGSFLIFTIFVKISYGALLVTAPFVFAFVARRQSRYYTTAFATAALLVAIFPCMIGWDFNAFFHDMELVAHAHKAMDVNGFLAALSYLWPDLSLLLLLGIMGCAGELLFAKQPSLKTLFRISLITLTYGLYAVGIVMTNSPNHAYRESPVLSIGSLIILCEILEVLARTPPNRGVDSLRLRKSAGYHLGFGSLLLGMGLQICYFAVSTEEYNRCALSFLILLLGILCLTPGVAKESFRWGPVILIAFSYLLAFSLAGPATARNMNSLFIALNDKRSGRMLPAAQVFQSGGLKGLQILNFGGDPILPTSYVGKVQEGVDLIERTGNSGKPVATLDFSNPFNIIEGVKPSVGCPLSWELGLVFSATSAPDEYQVFNGAQVVMVPKEFGSGDQKTLDVFEQLYGAYLRRHYMLAGESEQWRLFEEK